MPRKTTPTRFTVIGRGQFPIDMLRYDACWPASSHDSAQIAQTFSAPRTLTHVIHLNIAPGYTEPTVGRWSSFGWAVQS